MGGVVSREDLPELIGQILDGFEDFLAERDIRIFNPEQDEIEDPAVLCGADYTVLYSYVESTLINWKVVR